MLIYFPNPRLVLKAKNTVLNFFFGNVVNVGPAIIVTAEQHGARVGLEHETHAGGALLTTDFDHPLEEDDDEYASLGGTQEDDEFEAARNPTGPIGKSYGLIDLRGGVRVSLPRILFGEDPLGWASQCPITGAVCENIYIRYATDGARIRGAFVTQQDFMINVMQILGVGRDLHELAKNLAPTALSTDKCLTERITCGKENKNNLREFFVKNVM